MVEESGRIGIAVVPDATAETAVEAALASVGRTGPDPQGGAWFYHAVEIARLVALFG
jgi:hypothetical protein